MEVSPIKNRQFAYNPDQDQMLEGETLGRAEGRPDLVHVINASNSIYSKTFNHPSSIRVNNNTDIKNHVENEEKAHISELLKITCTGDNPEITIGSVVEINMSLKQELSFISESLGKFLITSIQHTIDERGHYQNTFEGLVSTTERLAVKNYRRPQPDMQLADVLDNDDPNGQGRVKVKFKWQCQVNDPTEWLRVMSPNAGTGQTGANRGFHVIPEKGDQVVVAFEEGNIARPVVMGSVYHGKSGDSKGFKNSNTKGMTSRMGSALIFNDEDHSLHLGTDPGNYVDIKNETGFLELKSKQKIVLTTGSASITLNTDGSILIDGSLISLNATTVGKQSGAVVIQGEEAVTVITKQLFESGSKGVTINSEAIVSVKGSQVDIN